MKTFFAAILSAVAAIPAFAADVAAVAGELAAKAAPNTITYKAENGWLYSKNELLHLAKGALADGQTAKKSACRKPANADPIPALKAFNDELAKCGMPGASQNAFFINGMKADSYDLNVFFFKKRNKLCRKAGWITDGDLTLN